MTPERLRDFEAAKLVFETPAVLSRPDPSFRFVLQTNASARGMGAALMQEEAVGRRRIISFARAKFSGTEIRYHCNEQECLAIMWAIKRYCPFLDDKTFILRTDSKTQQIGPLGLVPQSFSPYRRIRARKEQRTPGCSLT